jgi:hypothetical protein
MKRLRNSKDLVGSGLPAGAAACCCRRRAGRRGGGRGRAADSKFGRGERRAGRRKGAMRRWSPAGGGGRAVRAAA